MKISKPKGVVFRCLVCGAELAVLSPRIGDFAPRCCSTDMVLVSRRLVFYSCPVCGAEIGVIGSHGTGFEPRCCDRPMIRRAA